MEPNEDLAELKQLYSRRDNLSQEEGRSWTERISELLNRLTPERAAEFDAVSPYLFAGLTDLTLGPLWTRIGGIVRAAIADCERAQSNQTADTSNPPALEDSVSVKDPRAVFVVHGRNEALRKSLFAFLRALGLRPLEWSQAVAATAKAAPYIGEVLHAAFSAAQAVVVLLSPDDEVRLSESLWDAEEDAVETTLQAQARPNVLFEAGMAFGTHPERTILVQVGDVKPFSDIGGRYVLRLDNSARRRTDLADRLELAGCPVDRSGRDWLDVGELMVQPGRSDKIADQRSARSAAQGPEPLAELDVHLGYLGSWKSEQLIISNIGDATAHDIAISVDASPIGTHSWCPSPKIPVILRPGEQFGLKILLAHDSPERVEIQLDWNESDGSRHTVEKLLQLI